MTGSDISEYISKKYNLSKSEGKKTVELFFKIFAKFLKEENRIEIRKLGVFTPKVFQRNNRYYLRVNFKTSETIMKILNNK
jgi:nucleoid DNA-binding protein